MHFRCIGLPLAAALVGATVIGCQKSAPTAPPASPAATESIARVHWLGKQRLAAETNAASFMDIWHLPASAKLEAQTLDKLSLAPWRMLKGDAATNGAPIALLRPLLDDLVQAESYLEIRGATNPPGELAFAIRLSPERGGLWQTNLAIVLESLTGVRPVAATGNRQGWSLKKHDAPNLVELTRAGDWTVIGLASEQNALLGEVLARLERDRAPFAARATNFWLEAGLDLRGVSRALSLGWNLPEDLPKISMAVIGDGKEVLTRGRLDFTRPQSFALEPWNLPTNLVHDPLISFTAIRGVQPWLASLKMWNDLQLGAPPNQLCFWGLEGMPLLNYFAAPLPDASHRVQAITELLVQKCNPWMATNAMGHFAPAADSNGVVWTDAPIMSPFLRSVDTGGNRFVFGGLLPNAVTNQPPPDGLLPQILGRTNLVGYDWELTGRRIESWLFTGQLLRMVLHRAQLPFDSARDQCAGTAWFRAAAPTLGNCATYVTQTGTDQLSFARRSTIGFTAVELHWLADWLESPQFPRGLHTLLVPAPPPPDPEPKP
ncbi:MAG: hypothetical protein MUF81_12305 [Verrucomicrobia bacterium]|jgi:hypothetical protein|nr:hypothetical protein [Verrucomicrobiota bacterium]